MENIVELAKAGKVIRVCFPHKEHKRMWGILSEWEGTKTAKIKCALVFKRK